MIIPARNEGWRIEHCLRALRGQDLGRPVEIIVVDNGSTDDTAARAARFPVTVVREPRPGRAIARNAGIRAARGDVLCFIDADCVPRASWLRELLVGSEDPTIGAFVGEFVPLAPDNPVSRYIHERRLICQYRLLSQSPPAAATGNIAYRRSVFDSIGLFDEQFAFGEDGDLFWRMVRSRRFRYRYNGGAIVAHAHCTGTAQFLRRTFWEGTGLTRFRRKHREDLPPALSSFSCAVRGLLRVVAGAALYPVRVAQGISRQGLPARRAMFEAFLDKAQSLSRMAGIVHEYRRNPEPPAPPDHGEDDARWAFRDSLRMDLKTARLLARPRDGLLDRARGELDTLGRSLADLFPGSSVLLTGSLFAGEGRVSTTAGDPHLLSDYDFFVVTPRIADTIPALARPRIDRLMSQVPPPCANIEIGLVWKPLLKRHHTTIGGAVIAGREDIVGLLRDLRAPRGFSALLHAYRCLTLAPLAPAEYADLCASALVRFARALLFSDADGLPRRHWIALFSVETVAAMTADWAPVFGADAVRDIREAADFLLGLRDAGPTPERHGHYVGIAREIAARVPPPSGRVFALKQLHRMLRTGRFGGSGRAAGPRLLEGLQTLADSWSPDGFDRSRIAGAVRIARELGLANGSRPEDDSRSLYARLQQRLSDAACYNPHRVSYVRPGGAR